MSDCVKFASELGLLWCPRDLSLGRLDAIPNGVFAETILSAVDFQDGVYLLRFMDLVDLRLTICRGKTLRFLYCSSVS